MTEENNIQPESIEDASLNPELDKVVFEPGSVQPRELTSEMQESYLDYAMSVIVSRALPDVRDGLKPVHRRILFAMHELGLRATAKYRKSATVVGEVLGKYHPHGDVAVYDSMVRMAQVFSMRYQLVDGQGNFGSIDGDSPAAMRYTEARMAKITEELLTDIEKDTVDFSDNYDASRQEPTVLPARIPNLLLNGSLGIAVGMATNIPPHNITEICEGVIQLIANPEITIEELMQYIPGPDFPTGATIFDKQAILQAYSTGKGSIVMRATAAIEEHKNSFRILVTDLPYQVNKAELIQKIAELVKTKRIDGISDIRDESDRKEGIRVVIELRHNAYPKKILNQLYDFTALQSNFYVNLVALVDGIQPRLLTLKNILEEYIKHRQVVITRRTEYDLRKTKERVHILEGLKIALDHIDAVITTIRNSPTKEVAHTALQEKFKLSPLQASAILEMRLSALAGLERKKVEDELAEKMALIKELEAILADPKRILSMIVDDLKLVQKNYGDERRTKIVNTPIGKFSLEDLVPNEQVIVTLTRGNYIKRVSVDAYRSQQRGGKGIMGMETREEDAVEHLVTTFTHSDIYFFTDKGRIFSAKVYDLPSVARTAKGQPLVNIIQLAPEEKVTSLIVIDPDETKENMFFFMATKNGTVKKTEVLAYKNIRKTGIIAINLNKGDILKFVRMTSGSDSIMLVTKQGQGIYFKETDVRPMGRSAAGVRGIKLRSGDEVISCDVITADVENTADLLTVLENGYGKRTLISKHFHTQNRGGIGIRASKTTTKTGSVVEASVTGGEDGDLVIISRQGQMIRLSLKSVKRLGRDTMGVTLMRLKGGDTVSSAAIIKEAQEEQPVKPVAQTPAVPTPPKSATKDIASPTIPKPNPSKATGSKKDNKEQVDAKTKTEPQQGDVNYWGGKKDH